MRDRASRQGIGRAGALATLLLGLIVLAPQASAHSGGLNAQGCHTNRRTGDHHCHRSAGPARVPSSRPQGLVGSGAAFANCAAARSAGAAPVRRGQSGYGPHLDRDNDGVGCE